MDLASVQPAYLVGLALFGAAAMSELFTLDYPDRRSVLTSWTFLFVAASVLGPSAAGAIALASRLTATAARKRPWFSAFDAFAYGVTVFAIAWVVRLLLGPPTHGLSLQAAASSVVFVCLYTTCSLGLNNIQRLGRMGSSGWARADALTNVFLVPVAIGLLAAYTETGFRGMLLVIAGYAALLLIVRSSVNTGTLNGELKQAYEQLDRQQRELEAALELNREYGQVISHDLRGPLTSMMGHAELLTRNTGPESPDTASIVRHVDRILHNGQRMVRLIDNLQTLNLREETPLADIALVDAPALLELVIGELQPSAEERRIHLDVRMLPGLAPLLTSEWMLRQIMENLVSNAVKYSRDEGNVWVELDQIGPDLRLEVNDDGIGISAEDQARLFTKFFRGDSERVRSIPGTGLGLALTNGMVQRLGGRIEVSSQLGRGSRFTIFLPAGPPLQSQCA